MDLVRIDAFDVKGDEQVWFNELEIDAAIHIVGYEDYILQKIKNGYKKVEKNRFLEPNADNKFNKNCFKETREIFKSCDGITQINKTCLCGNQDCAAEWYCYGDEINESKKCVTL